MKRLIIVGAGGFGRELLQWIKDINKVSCEWDIKGFIDDNLHALDGKLCDYDIIGSIKDYKPTLDEWLALAVANPKIKENLVKDLKEKGARFATIIHPSAIVSDFATIGEGVVMYPNSGVNANAILGDFVTLLSSGVGHDACIGDYATISSYCDITGGVQLGKRVFFGSHVTVVPQRKIGDDVYVAAGSVVITNIKKEYRVMGNPAVKMDI